MATILPDCNAVKTPTDGNIRTLPPVNMILDGVDEFSKLLQRKNDKGNLCSFWVDDGTPPSSKTDALDLFTLFTGFWQEDILTDLVLLVGPDQVAIKAHRLILAAHFDYFKTMFTCGLVESSKREVSLPFVSPQDLMLILTYAYSGEVKLKRETVFKMTVMANYFGCKILLEKCCKLIKKFTNWQNCVKLLEAAFRLDISPLKEDFILVVVDKPWMLNINNENLPIELLLEIIQHPAAVMCGDGGESEKRLFYFIWNKVKHLPTDEKIKYIPKMLMAIHLPVTDKHFLFLLLREFGHIPEAKGLVMKAGEEVDPTEVREWYLERYLSIARLHVSWQKKKEKNGYYKYSRCVLIKGLPFYVYTSYSGMLFGEEYLHVDSPIAIERLGLPYKVVVYVSLERQWQWVCGNTYHNGVVQKSPVRLQRKYSCEKQVELKVTFQ